MRIPRSLLAAMVTIAVLATFAPESRGQAGVGRAPDAGDARGTGGEPARPLNGRGLENLLAFSRLLGFVRYFHPSDEAAATDWDRFAIDGVRAVEGAGTPEELAAVLNQLFRPVAPTVSVFTTVGEMPGLPRSTPPADSARAWIVAWRQVGLDTGQPGSSYHGERVRVGPPADARLAVQQGLPSPHDPWVADLTHGISCVVPLALYADDTGTLPHASETVAATPASIVPTGNDRAARLAVVALAWNALQHFYPYFDLVPAHWPSTLARTLMEAAAIPDEPMFLLTLERMLAELRDGQAGAACLRLQPSGRLPLLWEWVEGRLVITRRGPEAPEEIRAGDVVTAMSNLSVEEAVRAAESITSGGTPAHRRRRALEELARGPAGRPVRLDLQRPDGAVYTVEVARIDLGPNAGAGANTGTGPNTGTGVPSTRPALREARPPQLAEVGIGVRYCDLCGVDEDSLRALLPALAAARGVVLDLRGCSDTPAIFDHLIGAPVDAPRVQVPVVTRPDREALTYQESSQQRTPAEPRLRGRAAFLIDASVTGNAEIALSIVERERLAEIVGENSAGSCGDIALVPLAGGYAIQFTETRVVKPDGSRLFGVGVRPTVPVARTIAGIAGRHDEILERAVDLLREAATTR